MSNRKPYNDCAGYVASRRHPVHRGWLVILKAEEAGLDTAGGPWVVSCETHHTLRNHTSLSKARDSMKSPDFCEACEAHAAVCEAKRTVRSLSPAELNKILLGREAEGE